MEEQLISFETAVCAKERGFDIRTDKGYHGHRTDTDFMPLLLWNDAEEKEPELGYAPTQALLQKWLRDEHDLIVIVSPANKGKYFGILYPTKDSSISYDKKDTYEEALEVGLIEALKLI